MLIVALQHLDYTKLYNGVYLQDTVCQLASMLCQGLALQIYHQGY